MSDTPTLTITEADRLKRMWRQGKAPHQIAADLNQARHQAAEATGAKAYRLLGKRGIGVIYKAFRLGLIDSEEERDRLIKKAEASARKRRPKPSTAVRKALLQRFEVCSCCATTEGRRGVVRLTETPDPDNPEDFAVLCARCQGRLTRPIPDWLPHLRPLLANSPLISFAAAKPRFVPKPPTGRRYTTPPPTPSVDTVVAWKDSPLFLHLCARVMNHKGTSFFIPQELVWRIAPRDQLTDHGSRDCQHFPVVFTADQVDAFRARSSQTHPDPQR